MKIIIDRRASLTVHSNFFTSFFIFKSCWKNLREFLGVCRNLQIFVKNDKLTTQLDLRKILHENLKKQSSWFSLRKSFNGVYSVVDGAPRNPEGRTGIQVYNIAV